MFSKLRNSTPPSGAEQRAVILVGKNISYTLKRSKRRSIGLRIDDRGLTVNVPLRASEKWLLSVLQEKAHWVVEKLDDWQSRMPLETHWQHGEKIPYLGELLSLRVTQSLFHTNAQRRNNELWVFVADAGNATQIEQSVTQWYQHEAMRLFAERGAHYAPLMTVAPRAIKLSSAKTQWGCCMANGTVRLNVQLIKLPLRLIDYVVVHELAHLREMNHSAAFWSVVASMCPNYARLRSEIRGVSIL